MEKVEKIYFFHDRTETRNRGQEACLALLSERAAAVVEGDGATILQLNVEGLTNVKLTIIEQLAYTNKMTAIPLQETLWTWWNNGETNYPGIHPSCTNLEQHDLATFVRQDTEWSLEAQSENDS